MNVKELANAFHQLSAAERQEFFKQVMPAMCEAFRNDPKLMMTEMMPLCREMMQNCGMDVQMMMSIMAEISQKENGR
jgi:hypothetical protein